MLVGFGSLLLLVASYVSARVGARLGAGTVMVVALFLGTSLMYVYVPHVALAATVVLFATVPALKVFVSPQVGGVKDLVCLAAIAATLFLVIFDRRRTDKAITSLALLLLALYLINAGGAHGAAWAQGVRLFGEPVLLLLVGMLLPNPRRNLRYALAALAATACMMAAYGLLQQALGPSRLVSLGYSFSSQVRTIGSHLRSFGTLDDPFAYAAFLLFGLTVVLFWWRRGPRAWGAATLLLLGLAVSYVRTAALILVAFAALGAVRAGRGRAALFLASAAAIVAALTLAHAGGTQTQAFAVYTYKGGSRLIPRPLPGADSVLLNGRVSAWRAGLGNKPIEWVFGRGVGTVGTAAARASYSIAPPPSSAAKATNTNSANGQAQAVDSGYLAAVADVGVLGLVLLLALLARIAFLGWRAAQRGIRSGWFTLALLVCMMIDALTRASFTGFPTAFLGLLLLGVSLAAAEATPSSSQRGTA